MSTINISLPADQVSFIDGLVEEHGFANRSEFVRSIFRFLKGNPSAITQAMTIPLASPPTKNGDEVMSSFRATGLYSEAFLKDLEEGINDSSYFSKTSTTSK